MRRWLLGLCVAVAGCGDSGFVNTPDEGWGRNDTLTLTRTGNARRLIVRLDRTFRYKELWLTVNDSTVCVAVDERRGVGMFEATVKVDVRDSVMRIAHCMEDDCLRGVISVGIDKSGFPQTFTSGDENK